MKSNWQTLKEKSTYHFDSKHHDRPESVMTYLGHVEPNWAHDLKDIVDNAQPATWATRGYKGEGLEAPPEELATFLSL